jgi:methylated-DNA-[protein]-cysteine S-methyltransferase
MSQMKQAETIYWEYLALKEWRFCLAATDNGLCRILQPNEHFDVFKRWVDRYFSKAVLVRDQKKLSLYITQLNEYFEGKRKTFDFQFDLRGTPFQVAVWRALLNIPYSTTKNYSQIAEEVNRDAAVRAVGAANGANPIPIVVPCHRVIGKNGKLTGYRGGLDIKEELLNVEGVKHIWR